MLIKNVQQLDGTREDVSVNILEPYPNLIDGSRLTMLPALIDPHVHFRTPGAEHKEDWITGAQAAVQGGVTTVFDMPNNMPGCTTLEAIKTKHALIRSQLDQAGIPLSYYLYFGADRTHLKEIPKAKEYAIGIKVFMGSSTGDLLIDDDAVLKEIFIMAQALDMIVSVHAEDETLIRANRQKAAMPQDPSVHSKIRSPEAALTATKKAVEFSAKYQTRLCILHLSTKEEVALIKQAKASGVPVFAEAAPHHLILTTEAYEQWGTKVQVNPPLREEEDRQALWNGIKDKTIDFIGTDHAPHTLAEKGLGYGKAPSGIPSIELLLPLLLNAANAGSLDLQTVADLTCRNIQKIFRLQENHDFVLVDLNLRKTVDDRSLKTKCGWSPYAGQHLTGWPLYTVMKNRLYPHHVEPYE